MKFYSGIGSRETPSLVLSMMEKVGEYLATKDYILRSGGANGADKHFEMGCDRIPGKKEIYLPWKAFNYHQSNKYNIPTKAMKLAKEIHPNWSALSDAGKKLMARNCMQVLGEDLKTKSEFIICYTEEGKGKGGTGQAIRLADSYDIPIFDFGKFYSIKMDRRFISKQLNFFLGEFNLT